MKITVFCLLLIAFCCQAQEVRVEGSESPSSRRLLDFWSLLFFIGGDGCPPIGPPHEHCMAKKNAANNGGSNGDGSSNGSDGNGNDANGNYANGNYGGDGSGTAVSSAADGTDGANKGVKGVDPSSMSFWLIVGAVVAAMVAAVAVGMGQRKKPKEHHPLTGSVARRMGLFSTFANTVCGSVPRKNPRVVEMTMSQDDAPYSMA